MYPSIAVPVPWLPWLRCNVWIVRYFFVSTILRFYDFMLFLAADMTEPAVLVKEIKA